MQRNRRANRDGLQPMRLVPAGPVCVAPLLDKKQLDEMLARAEMAAEVTLPVEVFRDLVLQARKTA
jgi:hypothetical protein